LCDWLIRLTGWVTETDFPLSFLRPLVAPMPRLLKKPSQRSSPPAEEPGLVAVEDLPLSRRPYGSRDAVFGVEGRISTQAGVFAQILSPDSKMYPMQAIHGQTREGGRIEDSADGEEEEEDIIMSEAEGMKDEAEARKRSGKKERQWKNWSEVIIPAMLEPYMELLRESESLRDLSGARNHQGCQGCGSGRCLEVICIYFESMFPILLASSLMMCVLSHRTSNCLSVYM